MTCLTPDLSAIINLTDYSLPLMASVSFIMDAVGGLVTDNNPALRYFDDPVVHQFDGYSRVRQLYDDDSHLEIKVWVLSVAMGKSHEKIE